ncbi:hypothetical protein I5398_11705 [Citrobacter freundii]|uniref:hypothetical protein n=1 Tax=Citrobacter TaxID=544 RepID=UPI001E0EEDBA|nr:hypothetical protein [Citrobacter sp. Cpo035]MBJ8796694.1 hypothetical protein [Citrobacter freundii]MDM2915056.1 hypothetical protein [Citrobacter sp. Cpo035]
MTSFIKVPFASSGDKSAVPDTDAGGGVNMTQGYGQAYSLDPATDPSAKRIERDKMNWLFNRITQAINEIQSGGVAPFITSADNGGSAFSYGKGALVSLGEVVYQSLVASNTSTPPGANWSALPEKIQPLDTTLTALAGLVGAANKLPYFNGADTAALTDLTSIGRDIIGKSTVAEILAYLGLTNFADKNSSNEQMFNGVVASKKGVSAASSDGNRRVNLFVSDTGYELIVYIDGKYNNSIQIPTKYGTMALLDDVSNSVQSAPPPIGIPFLWPLSAMPNTVVPEWASNVFLKMNDATFSASTYPALARVWPGLKLTDCRGEFLRIWDDGRGVDSGRALLSAQGDAMRNFTGNAGFFTDGLFTYASGAFKLGPSSTNKATVAAGSGANAYVTLDPSTVVPTASENRPRNVAFNLLVRAK